MDFWLFVRCFKVFELYGLLGCVFIIRNPYANSFVLRLEIQTNKTSCWNFDFVFKVSNKIVDLFDTCSLMARGKGSRNGHNQTDKGQNMGTQNMNETVQALLQAITTTIVPRDQDPQMNWQTLWIGLENLVLLYSNVQQSNKG